MPEMFLVEGVWHGANDPQKGYVSDDTDFRASSDNLGLRVVRIDRFLVGGDIKIDRDDTVIMFYSSRKAGQLMALCESHRVAQHPEKNASFRVVKKLIPMKLVKMNQNKGFIYAWEKE